MLGHDRALSVIALLGLRGVDIGLFEGHDHLKPSRELARPARNGGLLKRQLDAHGLRAADLFLQLNASFADCALNHPDPNRRAFARESFERTLDYAVAAESDHLTLLPGTTFEGELRSASLSRSAEELAWRVELAKSAKVRVAVEPHVGSLIDTPRRALALAGQVAGLGFTLDYAHFKRAGFEDSAIEPLTARATHVHARSARPGRLQSSLNWNAIGFKQMLAALHRQGFGGWIALEYVWIEWEHCNEVDVLSESIKLRDHLLAEAAKI